MLQEYNAKNAQFRLLPQYKVKSEGEVVRISREMVDWLTSLWTLAGENLSVGCPTKWDGTQPCWILEIKDIEDNDYYHAYLGRENITELHVQIRWSDCTDAPFLCRYLKLKAAWCLGDFWYHLSWWLLVTIHGKNIWDRELYSRTSFQSFNLNKNKQVQFKNNISCISFRMLDKPFLLLSIGADLRPDSIWEYQVSGPFPTR